jgi:uncharacterized protein (TIGR00369 family)
MPLGGISDMSDTLSFGVSIPFVEHLGFKLKLFDGGRSQIDYQTRPEHVNSFDVTHGGVIMTLMDVTMAAAARSMRADMGVVTIEMKTSFMRPCQGLLHGKGRLMHQTASMAFTEASIFDADGNECAHASGTFKYVKRGAPVGGRHIDLASRSKSSGTNAGTPSQISTD